MRGRAQNGPRSTMMTTSRLPKLPSRRSTHRKATPPSSAGRSAREHLARSGAEFALRERACDREISRKPAVRRERDRDGEDQSRSLRSWKGDDELRSVAAYLDESERIPRYVCGL